MPSVRIASLRDLDAAVAEHVFGPRPSEGYFWGPLSEEWLALAFSTDPAASYALRQRMREDGWEWSLAAYPEDCHALIIDPKTATCVHGCHPIEHVAFALAALAAKGITLEFAEGWDRA